MLKGWSRSAQLLSAALEPTDLIPNALPRSGFVLGREGAVVPSQPNDYFRDQASGTRMTYLGRQLPKHLPGFIVRFAALPSPAVNRTAAFEKRRTEAAVRRPHTLLAELDPGTKPQGPP